MAHTGSSRFACLLVVAVCLGGLRAPKAYARDGVSGIRTPRRVVRASWYGRPFRGKRTASGTSFNPSTFTAAHRTIELGSKVKVTALRSGRSVVVEITDRGPYYPGRDIDLSYAAAHALGIVRSGLAMVRVEVINQEQVPATPMMTALSLPLASWLPRAVVE